MATIRKTKQTTKTPKGKKVCCRCNRTKKVSEFHVYRAASDGLLPRCKNCECKRQQEKRIRLERVSTKTRKTTLTKRTTRRNKR